MKPGTLNLITDVAGLRVGNAGDGHVKSGTTVLIGDSPFVAAVHVMGGAPGARETDLLAPDKMVQEVDALVLSGGSVRIGRILHPSPASPAANRGWAEVATSQLKALGVEVPS